MPSLNLKTDEISLALGRGKHTTRHVELINICDGLIADTPGFSSLDFNGMTNEDIINLDIVGSEPLRVTIQIGVKNDSRIVFGNYKAGMINIMEFGSHKRSSFC